MRNEFVISMHVTIYLYLAVKVNSQARPNNHISTSINHVSQSLRDLSCQYYTVLYNCLLQPPGIQKRQNTARYNAFSEHISVSLLSNQSLIFSQEISISLFLYLTIRKKSFIMPYNSTALPPREEPTGTAQLPRKTLTS